MRGVIGFKATKKTFTISCYYLSIKLNRNSSGRKSKASRFGRRYNDFMDTAGVLRH